MNKLIQDFLTSIHKDFQYPVFWYDTKDKKFGIISKNKIETKPIPSQIITELNDNDIFSKKFIKNDKEVIFYFFRQFLDDRKIILVLQDDESNSHLNHFLSIILKAASNFYHDANQNERELDFMREELAECEAEISVYDEKLINIEDELFEKSKEVDRLSELVEILKKSRSKLMKMVDSMHLPLFSMDINFDIVNVNKALGDYLGIEDLASFVGRKCFKVIYNNSEKCTWCKADEVKNNSENTTQHITTKFQNNELTFSQTMFPILENNEVVEIGEYLIDVTSEYKLIDSLEKSKEKLRKISKDKIDKISEISALKKEYNTLYEDYEEAKNNILKLKTALEKIISQDSVTELLKLKTELKELKIKYMQSSEAIKNYESKLKLQEEKLNELNKKSIYSMDRLLNILNNKQEIFEEDGKKVLEFLNSQIKILKDNLVQEEENNAGKSSD